MDSSRLKILLIVIFAAFVAIYLGVAAATAQLEAIAWVGGALALVIILALGKNVWVLIPLSLMLTGGLNFLPGAPFPWWLATMVAGGMLSLRFLTRAKDTFVFRFTWLDFAIVLQVIAILQSFLRNPTGLSIMGGETVGGKTYIIYALAFTAYATMSVMKSNIREFRIVVIAMLMVSILDGLLMVITQLSPQVASIALPIYSAADFGAAQGMEIDVTESRLTGAQDLARTLGLAAFTLFIPLSAFNPLHPMRFVMIMTSLSLCLLSGFRSALGGLLIFFLVGSLVRKRYLDVVLGFTAAVVGLSLLMISGFSRELPFGAQRILSVLPFMDVDDNTRKNAEDSSEWRFEMWRLALGTDRYIKNKLLGDGFGYSADELRAALDSAYGDQRMLGQANQQDMMLAKGSYHGFHVEAVRFTGAFGLLMALVSMGIFFRYSLKLIHHFRGRPEWGYVLFICVPFLIHPFYYMLIFGSYKNAFPLILAMAGMLKILDNIRVDELATARAADPLPEPTSSPSPLRKLPPSRFPHPAKVGLSR
jgi:hypothetical protein